MRVNGYENILQAEALSTTKSYGKKEDTDLSGGFPASWGSDTYSISAAARSAQQAAQTEGQADRQSGDDASADEAAERFSSYMRKKTGVEGNNGGDLESLKARLKELQSKIAAVAKKSEISDIGKDAQMNAIQQEMNQVIQQIAEAEARAAEEAGA